MKKRYVYVGAVLVIGVLVFNSYLLMRNNKEIQRLTSEKESIVVPKKNELSNIANSAEVTIIKNEFQNKVNLFLKDEYTDDKDNSGYDVLRNIFIIIGSSEIILNRSSTHEERVAYYKPFSYKFSNFAMRYSGEDKVIIMNVELYYDGENQNRPMDLVEFTLDKTNVIKAGRIYGTAK